MKWGINRVWKTKEIGKRNTAQEIRVVHVPVWSLLRKSQAGDAKKNWWNIFVVVVSYVFVVH